MEPLADRLRQRIRNEGPLRFSAFMEAALYDPHEGYYAGEHAVARSGPAGDFVTAPTLSPSYGACLARFCVEAWQRLGRPDPFPLIEVGGGDGSLIRTLLTAWHDEDLERPDKIELTFVDKDPSNLERARHATATKDLCDWVNGAFLDDLPAAIPASSLLLCNELWDNLPVDVYRTDEHGTWHERRVGLDGDDFEWVDRALGDDAWSGREVTDPPILHQVEHPVGTIDWLTSVTERVTGATLLLSIDYGMNALNAFMEPRTEGTLTTFREHEQGDDILADPGTHDITYHVDLTTVGRAAEGMGWSVIGYATQAQFLVALGLADRIAAIAGRVRDEATWAELEAAKQLLLPFGLGERFKVMALAHGLEANETPLPGLDPSRSWDRGPR